MTKKLLMAATGALALMAASPAFAQTADVTINSQLAVQDGCIINGGPAATALLDFGLLQNAGGQTANIDAQTSTGAISVSCNVSSTTAAFTIGKGANGSTTLRTLQNAAAIGGAGEFVSYRLYATPGRTPASEYVPDGTSIPFNGGVITAGTPFEIVVYGRIAAGDANLAVSGNYTDNATGTLTF